MPLRILTISDLHLDHEPDWQMPSEWPDFDVAVFAGDIKGPPSEGMQWLRSVPGLEYCEIVFVAGNHEYYGREIEKEEERALETASKTRIHFLNPGSVMIEGTRFIGATLWTDYQLYGDRAAAMRAAGHAMNDHRLIKKKWDGTTAKFLPRDALDRHQKERAWLEEQLAVAHSGPTVVVTHHGVSHGSVHPRFAGDPVTPAFSSDMTALIEAHPELALWIHGHTHDGFDYSIGSTRVVCNPKGYGPHLRRGMPQPENPLFHPTKVVEVRQLDPVVTIP